MKSVLILVNIFGKYPPIFFTILTLKRSHKIQFKRSRTLVHSKVSLIHQSPSLIVSSSRPQLGPSHTRK